MTTWKYMVTVEDTFAGHYILDKAKVEGVLLLGLILEKLADMNATQRSAFYDSMEEKRRSKGVEYNHSVLKAVYSPCKRYRISVIRLADEE